MPGKIADKRLAHSDPDRLREGHLFDMNGVGLEARGPRINDPHDDAAEQQRQRDDGEAAKVLVAPFLEQQSRDRSTDEGAIVSEMG